MTRLPNKFVVEQRFHRRLSFKERLLILCGYNLQADSTTQVVMKNGSARARLVIRLTKQITAEDQARSDALEEKK